MRGKSSKLYMMRYVPVGSGPAIKAISPSLVNQPLDLRRS